MFVLLAYYFNNEAPDTNKADFLLNLGRLSRKHKFLSDGLVMAQFERVDLDEIVKELSDGVPSLCLIVAEGVIHDQNKKPTIVATQGILDGKDWRC